MLPMLHCPHDPLPKGYWAPFVKFVIKLILGLLLAHSLKVWLNGFLSKSWDYWESGWFKILMALRNSPPHLIEILSVILVLLIFRLCKAHPLAWLAAGGFFVGLPLGFYTGCMIFRGGGTIYLRKNFHVDTEELLCAPAGALMGVIIGMWIHVWRISRTPPSAPVEVEYKRMP
jgi:hypothetical protein